MKLVLALLVLTGCIDQEPTFVSNKDVEKAAGTGDTPTLCAGLRMKDETTRSLAAEKLKDYGLDQDCLCERLTFDGRWDPSILGGLAHGEDAEKLACVGKLLDDPAAPDRVALVGAMLKIPAVRPRLVTAAGSDADPDVRAAAIATFRATRDAAEAEAAVKWLESDPEPKIRAAAASALFGQKVADAALAKAAIEDKDATVRGAALAAWHVGKPENFAEVACKMLLTDPEPAARLAALGEMKATRDPALLTCLRTRTATEETSPEVRAALLRTLASSAAPEAAQTLCDAIPDWVRMYVKDASPAEGDDILKAQNDRDFEKSYECVQAAVRKAGGYTCAGRAYVGAFFRELGGKGPVPNCGGGPARASNEIVF